MKTLFAAIGVMTGLTTACGASEDCLYPGRHLTVRGRIVQSAFQDTDQGREFQHPFIAIAFDRPRCAVSEYSGKVRGIMIVEVNGISASWVGHYVALDASVEDNGGTIHYPTVVSFNSTRIRDVPSTER